MEDHNITPRPASESEEMYLLTTARLVESGLAEPIPLAALAQALAIQPVSANQMVHTLEEAGLLIYTPYKGVQLTDLGRSQAERILRYRRLWQAFLVDHLDLDATLAEALACEFEHATTEEAAGRLENYLARPVGISRSLSGDFENLTLAEVIPGQTVSYVGSPAELAAFLSAQGLQPGSSLRIQGRGPAGDLLLAIRGGNLHLTQDVAEKIFVTTQIEGC